MLKGHELVGEGEHDRLEVGQCQTRGLCVVWVEDLHAAPLRDGPAVAAVFEEKRAL